MTESVYDQRKERVFSQNFRTFHRNNIKGKLTSFFYYGVMGIHEYT